MQPGSNSAARIAELRREIARDKGIARRAAATAQELRYKAWGAEDRVRRAQAEIESMGGKVNR